MDSKLVSSYEQTVHNIYNVYLGKIIIIDFMAVYDFNNIIVNLMKTVALYQTYPQTNAT